jgi:hypothetical protein
VNQIVRNEPRLNLNFQMMEAKPLLNSLGQAFKIKVKSSSFGNFKYLPWLKTQLTNQRHYFMVPTKKKH